MERNVVALDGRTGEVRWRLPGSPVYASPILGADGAIYVGGTETLVRAAEPASGQILWQHQLVPQLNDWAFGMNATGALAHGQLYLPMMWGLFFALGADDGEVRWEVLVDRSVLHTTHYQATARSFSAAPVVTGDLVWIGGSDGKLRAVGAFDGAERWSMDLGVPISSGLVPAGCALYVATWDGTVRALAPETDRCVAPPRKPERGCGCQVGEDPTSAWGTVLLALFALALARAKRRAHRR